MCNFSSIPLFYYEGSHNKGCTLSKVMKSEGCICPMLWSAPSIPYILSHHMVENCMLPTYCLVPIWHPLTFIFLPMTTPNTLGCIYFMYFRTFIQSRQWLSFWKHVLCTYTPKRFKNTPFTCIYMKIFLFLFRLLYTLWACQTFIKYYLCTI